MMGLAASARSTASVDSNTMNPKLGTCRANRVSALRGQRIS